MIDDQSLTIHITSCPFLLLDSAELPSSAEGGSSFTIPDTALSSNTSSVNLEGGSSYFHLDVYIEWESDKGDSSGFPLGVRHTVTMVTMTLH